MMIVYLVAELLYLDLSLGPPKLPSIYSNSFPSDERDLEITDCLNIQISEIFGLSQTNRD